MAIDNMIGLPRQTPVRNVSANSQCILGKVGWDSNYKHVRPFSNADGLISYLRSSSEYREITNMTPVKNGISEVGVPYNQLIGSRCNYIAFRDNNVGEKWRFAFIIGADRASDNSSYIRFKLDTFQNVWYSTNRNACFTVREHVAKSADTIGANTVPENLETGDFISNAMQSISFGGMNVGIYATVSPDGISQAGRLVNNVYSGCALYTYPCNNSTQAEAINAVIRRYEDNGKISSIQSLFMYPDICTSGNATQAVVNNSSAFGGYIPQNNKLYTYPYCYCYADNNNGQSSIYKFEYSGASTTLTFSSRGSLATAPAVITYPTGYKGVATNYSESLMNASFPVVSWASDYFQAYYAQNRSSLSLSTIAGGATIAGGLITGNIGLALGGVGTIASQMAQQTDYANRPDTVHGRVLSENINTALGLNRVDLYTMSITAEMARRIDNYWTCFGYKTNLVKVPNVNSRSSFNYVETIDCGFTSASAEFEELRELRSIFDNGVTLWHTNDIGNYSLSNN